MLTDTKLRRKKKDKEDEICCAKNDQLRLVFPSPPSISVYLFLSNLAPDINLKTMRHSTALACIIFPFSSFLSRHPLFLSGKSINTHPHAHARLSLGSEAGFNVNENQPISSQLQTALRLRAQEGKQGDVMKEETQWGETERESTSNLKIIENSKSV